jgi:Tol biopolymer transport system component
MMPTERFERRLSVLLDELAQPRTPDYLDDLLRQTANTSQRPAWSLLERWLPMVDVARQPVLAPRIPWRSIGLGLALIGLLLAAIAVALIGSRQRLPEPFGLARNGLVAYASGGDIFTADPGTGVSTAIVSGPEIDVGPVFSRDGTRLVFERRLEGERGSGRLLVSGTDGSNVTVVTPDKLSALGSYQFSPDGSEVMFTSYVDGRSTISIARSDGSGVRAVQVGFAAVHPDYRPPDGAEIVFAGHDGPYSGLYAMRPDSTGLRTLVEPTDMVFDHVRWSPDGSEVAYSAWGEALAGPEDMARVHVTSADGLTTRILPTLPATEMEGQPIWSNDGKRLLIWRCLTPPEGPVGACLSKLAVVPADGRDAGVQLDADVLSYDDTLAAQVWAPDDGSILATPFGEGPTFARLIRWDPLTGQTSRVSWNLEGPPSWQRLAP